MISFSEVYFNKAIKTTKTRLLKDDPGLTVYSLSDEKTFDITIGDRVLSEEIVSGGRVPVYSANVYEEFGRIDKENMKENPFGGLPVVTMRMANLQWLFRAG